MTQRYKLFIEYDGTNFSGWQKQPYERTVEGVIEEALSTLFQSEIDIIGQGRTDAGVHALQQIAHADLPDIHDERRIIHAMRGLLPNDVSINGIEKTDEKFHSRFDAMSRTYIYRISNRPIPLDRHKTWYNFLDLKIHLLDECANRLFGEHDFLQFCIPNEDPHVTSRCTISESVWFLDEEVLIYKITGNRFLRQMVRRLVGTMVHVSAGKTSLHIFEEMLTNPDGNFVAFTAPSLGLTLKAVNYSKKGI